MRRGRTSGLLNPQARRFIQITQISHEALSRATRGAIGFDQRPILMRLAIFLAADFSEVHAAI
ncbi:hypothetical protein EDS67_27025 [candidate division KSB1 bacterium]|nr:MAG: hypothetical protein EDS67_27025 [candidate division KSB1 bacterium]